MRCRRCHRSDLCLCDVYDANTEAAIEILLTALVQAVLEHTGQTRLHAVGVLVRMCGMLSASLPYARILDVRDRLADTVKLAYVRPGETVH